MSKTVKLDAFYVFWPDVWMYPLDESERPFIAAKCIVLNSLIFFIKSILFRILFVYIYVTFQHSSWFCKFMLLWDLHNNSFLCIFFTVYALNNSYCSYAYSVQIPDTMKTVAILVLLALFAYSQGKGVVYNSFGSLFLLLTLKYFKMIIQVVMVDEREW